MDIFESIFNKYISETILTEGMWTSAKQAIASVKGATDSAKQTSISIKQTAQHARGTSVDIRKTSKSVRGFFVVATGALVLSLLKKAKDEYKKWKHKKCAKFTGTDLITCKIYSINKSINLLKATHSSECKKATDPDQCTKKIPFSISKYP